MSSVLATSRSTLVELFYRKWQSLQQLLFLHLARQYLCIKRSTLKTILPVQDGTSTRTSSASLI